MAQAARKCSNAVKGDSLVVVMVGVNTEGHRVPMEVFMTWFEADTHAKTTSFVGREQLEAAVHDAVMVFNDAEYARNKILQKLNLKYVMDLRSRF